MVSGCLLLIAGAVLVAAYTAAPLAPLVVALIAALLVAALLQPFVDAPERLRLPRPVVAIPLCWPHSSHL